MIVELIYALIYIALIVLFALVIVWAIETIVGFAIPPRIKQIGVVILVLLCLLVLVSLVPLPLGHWRYVP